MAFSTASNSLTVSVIGTALAFSVVSIFLWSRRRRNYVRVGKIKKLLFYPVKSLKAVEVTRGKCTKLGFEVDGFLDRSFMLVNDKGILVSQREAPNLVLLTPHIAENYLTITGPNTKDLKIEIKKAQSPSDKLIKCQVHADSVEGVDCGDEAASWFQSYLNMEGIRLVRFLTSNTSRKYTKNHPFFSKLRKEHPAGFQDLGAFHMFSQASIDDVNSKQKDKEITVYNFRPNALVEGCEAYAEDSWSFMKFNSGAELVQLMCTTRCLMTTNDPNTGIMDKKEPLVSLRKYRITDDPKFSKVAGSVPCFGTTWAVLSSGEIEVGDDVFAVVEGKPKLWKVKEES